jgi:hypothetical protein
MAPDFEGINIKKVNIISFAVKVLISFSFGFLFCFNLSAQVAGGGYTESYLLRNVGARTIGMAGAYSAVANEPNSIFYNPAGLSSLSNKPMFSTMFSFLEFGRTHSTLSWGQSLNNHFGVGVGINNFTTGSFIARDIRGNKIGDFSDWQFAISGGASYALEFASVGMAVKYIANSLESSGTRGDGFALDIGTKFNVMDLFTFAVSMQNITGYMIWNEKDKSKENAMLPYTIRSGFAMEFGLNDASYTTRSNIDGELEEVLMPSSRYILLSLDGVLTQFENAPTVTMGIEVAAHEIISFRAGMAIMGDKLGIYQLFPMTIWGGGVSIKPPIKNLPFNTNIEYSVSQDQLAKSKISHHISLVFEF